MKTKKIYRIGKIRRPNWLRRELAVIIAFYFLCANSAFANPYGARIINGNVHIQTQGNILNITNSPNSIINWQGFSIGANEITRFIQQNSASAVLNRVTGQDPSAILGALQSNGRVFLVNPNGVLFGQGARIDVNGLIASTLNISNADFLAGKYNFTAGLNPGAIKNSGTINTPNGGQVYLIAPDIENTGIINSPGGDVLLAAGHRVELVDSADPFISVVVSAPENKAVNLGQIVAQSGRIGIYGGLIKQGGLVHANSAVVGEGGKIFFKAVKDVTLDAGSRTTADGAKGGKITIQSDTDTTLVSGVVTATGSENKGGEISILGNHVGLIGNALVDASGREGGGTVLVGGDYQGKNPEVQNAKAAYIGKDARIKADAGVNGDGGKVIVWSDEATRVYGAISARGGTVFGNGGFIETSGHYLDVNDIRVDARATNGKGGTWLLDPYNIAISGAANNASQSGAGTITWTATASPSTIQASVIGGQLDGGSNVIVDTAGAGAEAGNITLTSGITGLSNAGASTLTLKANNNISIGASITGNLQGLILEANSGSVSVCDACTIESSQLTVTATTGIFGTDSTTPLKTNNTLGETILNVYNKGTGPIRISDSSTNGIKIAGAKQDTTGQPISISSSLITFKDSSSDITTVGGAVNLVSSGNMTFISGVDITTAGGAVNLDTTGAGSNISHVAGSGISTSGAAITMKADNMGLAGAINAGSGKVTLRPTSAARAIDVGTDTTDMLGLTVSELNTITAGTLLIGDSTLTGNLGVTAALGTGAGGALERIGNGTSIGSLSLASGGAITQAIGVPEVPDATIAALPVGLNAYGSSVSLMADNPIGLIAGGTSGGNFAFRSLNQVTVTTVDGKSGITAGAGTVTLNSDTGINQNSGATISANRLILTTAGTGAAILTESNNVPNLGTIAVPGGFNYNNGNTGLTATGTISTTNSPVSINVGTGTYAQSVDIDIVAGTGAINITANDIALGANSGNNTFQTTGGLTIKPATSSLSIGLGGAGGLALSATEITDIAGGVTGGAINIGDNAAGTGTVSIGDNISFGAKSVSLSGGSFTDSGEKYITAQNLTLKANATGGNIGSSSDSIDVAVANLALNTAGGGSAYVKSSGNLNLGAVNVGTGIFDLYATGSISQSGILTAGGLSVTNVTSATSMVFDQDNLVSKIAVSAGAGSGLLFRNNANLAVGTVNGIAGINVGSAGALLHAAGNITIDSGQTITSAASGHAVVLNAQGNFINNAGSGAISLTGSGRWIVYSANPSSNTFGSLASGNYAVWNTVYDGTPPAGIPSGNRYVFGYQPTVTFTSTSLNKTYGNDATGAVATAYNVSGIHPGVAGVFLADTNARAFSGTPSVTSSGSGTSAAVGSYPVDVVQGSLSALNGYALSYASSGYLTVDPAILTITASLTGIVTKTYDGTVTAILGPENFLLSGFQNGDSATVTKTTGTYAAKNAGSGIMVTAELTSSDFSPVGSTNLSNYSLPTSASGNIGTITPASLTVAGITAQNKIYDATTAAVINTGQAVLTGIFGTDSVSFSAASGVFDDKNVGSGKPVTVSGLTLSGTDAGNYTLTAPTDIRADITPASLTIAGITAQNKIYDGTTDAVINTGAATLAGIFSGDAVTLNGGTGFFVDKNVGTGKAVTVSGINLEGGDAGNYVLSSTLPSTTADISKATLTIAAAAYTKNYDGTTAAGTPTYSGLQTGDTVTGVTQNYADKNAGTNKGISIAGDFVINDGNSGGNYSVTRVNEATGIINKAPLTVIADDKTRIYGDANPAFTGYLAGFAGGETLGNSGVTGSAGFTTAANESSNVGSYAITPNAGTLAADNYSFGNFVNGTLTVNKSLLSIIADNKFKFYGEVNPPLTATYAGFKLGQNESVLSGALSLVTDATKDSPVGPYKIVPSGPTSNNYEIAFVNGTLMVKADESVTQNSTLVTATNEAGKTETVVVAATDSGKDKGKEEDKDKDKDKDKKGDTSQSKEGQDSGSKKQSLPYCN